jgi:CubicO group peptidase (beta-lactamase class C family)
MSRAILGTVMPAVNGVFTARSLARIYGAYANGGAVEGRRLLKEDTVADAGRIQTRERDKVLFLNMRWRLGFHQAFTMRNRVPRGFGHFGFGGSGGWADPETGLSVAFVTNRLGNATTPVGDARLVRLGDLAVKIVRQA